MTYITRFAPTPSGELHFGSLVALTASFLECRAHQGRWIVRFDDLDTKRIKPEFQASIQRSLDTFCFMYDAMCQQSDCVPLYHAALDTLRLHTFYCTCSRKTIHLCRCAENIHTTGSLRLRVPDVEYTVVDRLQGNYCQNLFAECGNMVLQRADGILSYHLATVVDDYQLGITHIVRGFDLLASTPRQDYIRNLLGYPDIEHAHVPVVMLDARNKYSKQNHAPAISHIKPELALWHALSFLQQEPPVELQQAPLGEIWQWAVAHWSSLPLRNKVSLVYHPTNHQTGE